MKEFQRRFDAPLLTFSYTEAIIDSDRMIGPDELSEALKLEIKCNKKNAGLH